MENINTHRGEVLQKLQSRKLPFCNQQGERVMNRFERASPFLIICTMGNPDIVSLLFSKKSCMSVYKATMKSRKFSKDHRSLILPKCILIK